MEDYCILSPFALEWYLQAMDTSVSIWEREDLADPLDEIIRRTQADGLAKQDAFDLVLAQIPGLFGDSEKATYLGFRALGLRPKQALEILGLTEAILEMWREETPELDDFEYHKLPDLQRKINADIIRLQFMRNMTMFLFRDSLTIKKMLTDFEGMSNREYNYGRSIRRFYSQQDFLNLQKAVEPEKHRTNTLVLSFGNAHFEVVENEDETTTMKEIIDGDQGQN